MWMEQIIIPACGELLFKWPDNHKKELKNFSLFKSNDSKDN